MLYTAHKKNFRHHVHSTLQKRIRIFLIIGGASLAIVIWDIINGSIGIPFALASIVLGAIVGLITSRIFNLSWNHDGQRVVGRIDYIGWIVLAAYIVFEIARATTFQYFIHTGYDANAITFAFVSSALISRVIGLRGRIVRILKQEKVLG